MNVEMVKTALTESIQEIAKDKTDIVKDAKKMFTRTRKIAFETMIQGFIAMGGGKTINEITDYFKDSKAIPTESAPFRMRDIELHIFNPRKQIGTINKLFFHPRPACLFCRFLFFAHR